MFKIQKYSNLKSLLNLILRGLSANYSIHQSDPEREQLNYCYIIAFVLFSLWKLFYMLQVDIWVDFILVHLSVQTNVAIGIPFLEEVCRLLTLLFILIVLFRKRLKQWVLSWFRISNFNFIWSLPAGWLNLKNHILHRCIVIEICQR